MKALIGFLLGVSLVSVAHAQCVCVDDASCALKKQFDTDKAAYDADRAACLAATDQTTIDVDTTTATAIHTKLTGQLTQANVAQ